MDITLRCWSCGKETHIKVSRPPQFAFELIGPASDAGMVAYTDFRYNRTLIFCNSDCARDQLTKSNTFRKYPKHIA